VKDYIARETLNHVRVKDHQHERSSGLHCRLLLAFNFTWLTLFLKKRKFSCCECPKYTTPFYIKRSRCSLHTIFSTNSLLENDWRSNTWRKWEKEYNNEFLFKKCFIYKIGILLFENDMSTNLWCPNRMWNGEKDWSFSLWFCHWIISSGHPTREL